MFAGQNDSPEEEKTDNGMEDDVDQMIANWIQFIPEVVPTKR